nr:hypothetical protein GCM10020092_024920 [Actinoplanes digitatis]
MPAPRHWTRVKALRVASWIACVQNDRPRAEALLADARSLAARLPPSASPSPESAFIPLVEGNIAMFGGDHARAVPLFEQAQAVFRDMGALSGEMWTLAVLGLARGLSTDDPALGYPDLMACRDLAAANGEVWWRSFALWALSVLRWRAGDTAGAAEAAKESLEVGKLVEDEQFGMGLALEALGWAAEQRTPGPARGAAARRLGARVAGDAGVAVVVPQPARLPRGVDPGGPRPARRPGVRRGVPARRGADHGRGGGAGPGPGAPHRRGGGAAPRAETPAPPPTSDARLADLGLTPREREVIKLIAEGLSNREIAARLVVAQRTAEGHVENILSKLSFTSRAQVAGWLAARRDT